ncbi:MAG: RNA-binding protein [Rhodospirillaceae bacterium]
MTSEIYPSGGPAPGRGSTSAQTPVGDDPGEDLETGPTRRCIASGESLPVAELIRFVVGPDNTIVPDIAGRLPGRGLWLRARRDMIETAAQKRLFAKAARGNVNLPADLADTVAELLRRRCLNHLGLAQRAGLVASGAEKVRAQIATGRTAALVGAADGSEAERRKMSALVPGVPVVDVFTSPELGSAIGRDMAVHVALLPGRLTEMILEDAGKLRGFI